MAMTLASWWWSFMLLGFVAGLLSGSLGVGSGIIVVPALVLLMQCPQKSAQGMALALMVPMALLGVIQYARTPGVNLHWAVVGLLVAGAVLGVLVGTRCMARIPDVWLQRTFAVFIIVVGIRMLWPGRASGPAPGGGASATELSAGAGDRTHE